MLSDSRRVSGADSAPVEASRILVVDDEVVTRTLVTVVLSQEGYQVVTAESGRKAIDLLERGPFDVVITNLEMPGASGVEVLFAVRRIDPQCPVIIITGSTDIGRMLPNVDLDAVGYVAKPFSIDKIRGTVSRMLQKKKT